MRQLSWSQLHCNINLCQEVAASGQLSASDQAKLNAKRKLTLYGILTAVLLTILAALMVLFAVELLGLLGVDSLRLGVFFGPHGSLSSAVFNLLTDVSGISRFRQKLSLGREPG